MMQRRVHILMIDDDMVDVELVRRNFCKMQLDSPIVSAQSGEDALKLLRGESGHPRLPIPYLILLDIHMPQMDGLEFLEQVRNDPHLKQSVIFILSNSENPEHLRRAYQANVSGYIRKDWLYSQSDELVRLIRQFQNLNEFPAY